MPRAEAYYETDEAFYLVMEFIEGGELFDKLVDDGACSEAVAADMLRQVAREFMREMSQPIDEEANNRMLFTEAEANAMAAQS